MPDDVRDGDSYGAGGVRAATVEWMSRVPDDTPLHQMSIPGTHQSCALYNAVGGTNGWAVCQDAGLEWQLYAGVRCLDIRCRPMDTSITIHHADVYQKKVLGEVLDTCTKFLRDHPSEALIMRVRCEKDCGYDKMADILWNSYRNRANFYRNPYLPKLGDARGKIVLISENGEVTGKFGCPQTPSAGGGENTWVTKGRFTVQDRYNSLPYYKKNYVAEALDKASEDSGRNYMIMNYTSASGSGNTPFSNALELNGYTLSQLYGRYSGYYSPKRMGMIMMDYIDMPAKTEGSRDIDLIAAITRHNRRKTGNLPTNLDPGFVIWSAWTGKALDSAGGGSVCTWRYHGLPRQRWHVGLYTSESGYSYHALWSHEGGYLKARSKSDVVAQTNWGPPAPEWDVTPAEGFEGGFTIRNRYFNSYLCPSGSSSLILSGSGDQNTVWYFDQRVEVWPNSTRTIETKADVEFKVDEQKTGGYYALSCTLKNGEAEEIPKGWTIDLRLPPGVTIETAWDGAVKHAEHPVPETTDPSHETAREQQFLVTLQGEVPLPPGQPVTIHYSGQSILPESYPTPDTAHLKAP